MIKQYEKFHLVRYFAKWYWSADDSSTGSSVKINLNDEKEYEVEFETLKQNDFKDEFLKQTI